MKNPNEETGRSVATYLIGHFKFAAINTSNSEKLKILWSNDEQRQSYYLAVHFALDYKNGPMLAENKESIERLRTQTCDASFIEGGHFNHRDTNISAEGVLHNLNFEQTRKRKLLVKLLVSNNVEFNANTITLNLTTDF